MPRFITVDLDVRSTPRSSLDSLSKALTAFGTVQNDHRDAQGQFVSFALGESHETIESTISALISAIDQLDSEARSEWTSAASRVFNVGIEAGREPDRPIITLDAELVAAAAHHGAGVTFTHYPCHDRNAGFSHTTIA